MNLVQMFTMQPPSKANIAARLRQSSSSPMPVQVSHAPSAFYVRGNEVPRSAVLMPVPYTLGAQGGLAGLGAEGVELLPGIAFANRDAYNDFVGGLAANHWRDGGGSWDGISGTLLTNLSNALREGDNSVPNGALVAENARDVLKGLVKDLDRLQTFDLGIGGRSATRDQQYRAAMKALKTNIMTLPNSIRGAVARDVELAKQQASGGGGGSTGTGTSTGTGASTGGGSSYSYDLYKPRPGSGSGTQQSQGASTAAGGGFPTLAVVGGVAALGLVAVLVMRKKKG